MRRWDRLQDSYIEEYRARGRSEQTVAYTEARLERDPTCFVSYVFKITHLYTVFQIVSNGSA